MDYASLGRTGLTVSRVCLGGGGSSRLGHRRGMGEDDVVRLLHGALDLGITFFDTAPSYGTETVLGKALAGKRDGVVLSTKVRPTVEGTAMGGDAYCSAVDIRRSVEESLRRLLTDRLDIVHLHGLRPHQYDHVRDALLPELLDLRAAGKIRHLGVSESFGNDREHEVALRAVAEGPFDVLMLGYNIVNPSAGHRAIPAARAAGIGVMCMCAVRGALASPEAVRALVAGLVATGEVDASDLDGDDPLGFLLRGGVAGTLAEAAYRFCRHQLGIDVVMTGTGSGQHLEQNVSAILGQPLPDSVLHRLATAFQRVTSATGQLHDIEPASPAR